VPQVFKKHIVRYLDAAGRQVPKGTPGATRRQEESSKWYGRVPGTTRPVPLSTNKGAAERLGQWHDSGRGPQARPPFRRL
jgi:hypothetical protein